MRCALLPLVALVLSGCSVMSSQRTPDYECSLHDVTRAKCASMADSYKASKQMGRSDASSVQSVFEGSGAAVAGQGAPMLSNTPSNFPEPGQTGAPVFQQPKVMRAWVAPYVDADGNLRSGEYVYFSTPGQWNYGTMKSPGAAGAAMFEPSKASSLGFTPDLQTTSGSRVPQPMGQGSGTPAKPPEAAQSAAQGAMQANSPQATRATDTVGAVTQPYQRLAN